MHERHAGLEIWDQTAGLRNCTTIFKSIKMSGTVYAVCANKLSNCVHFSNWPVDDRRSSQEPSSVAQTGSLSSIQSVLVWAHLQRPCTHTAPSRHTTPSQLLSVATIQTTLNETALGTNWRFSTFTPPSHPRNGACKIEPRLLGRWTGAIRDTWGIIAFHKGYRWHF